MKPTPKTVRAGIRGSVPDAKLRKARIVLTSEGFRQGSIGGYTAYEKEHGGDVVKIGAPIGDRSRDVTVRGHENRHARRRSPKTVRWPRRLWTTSTSSAHRFRSLKVNGPIAGRI